MSIENTTEHPLKLKFDKPPIWDNACALFEININTVLFTYGDTIYIPGGRMPTEDLIEHERTHMKQQNYNDKDAALWWGKYLRDPQFRMEQEVEAYAQQYKHLCKGIKGREQRFRVRRTLGQQLSSPLYKCPCDLMTAMTLIDKKANVPK